MQIPKFIKDIKKYFMYEGSATPTTQDDLQAYMKNEHETLECLVDGLWQPETEYQEGHIVRSPNMPKGIEAKVKTGGYSATNLTGRSVQLKLMMVRLCGRRSLDLIISKLQVMLLVAERLVTMDKWSCNLTCRIKLLPAQWVTPLLLLSATVLRLLFPILL